MDDDINNVTDDADISMNDISKYEIEEGLIALANNKAAGLDFIPAELLKWGGMYVSMQNSFIVSVYKSTFSKISK